MDTPRVLLFGATGLVGGHLLPLLIAEGYSVTAVSRRNKPDNLNAAVEWICADISDPDWLGTSGIDIKRYQTIIHLAYATDGASEYNKAVTVESVRGLIHSIAKAQCPIHFIYIGSMTVYGMQEEPRLVDEKTPYNPISDYAEQKVEASKLACSLTAPGVATVLHPTGVYDATSKRIKMYRNLLRHNYIPSEARLGKVNIVHAEDVARAIMAALKRDLSRGTQEYIINGEFLPYPEWFRLLEATVYKKGWLRIPSCFRFVCRGKIRTTLNKLGAICPIHIENKLLSPMQRDEEYVSNKARDELHFQPQVTMLEVCERIRKNNALPNRHRA